MIMICGRAWPSGTQTDSVPDSRSLIQSREQLEIAPVERWRFVARLAAGLGLLVIVFAFIDPGQVLGLAAQVGWQSVALLFGLFVLDRLLMAYKWGLLLWSSGARISLWSLFKAYVYGNFAGSFLPATIGGDLVRFATVSRSSLSREALLISMILEKLIGFTVMAMLAFICVVGFSSHVVDDAVESGLLGGSSIWIFGAVTAAVFITAYLARETVWTILSKLIGTRRQEWLRGLVHRTRNYTGTRTALVTCGILTAVEQAAPVLTVFVLARSMDIDIGFLEVFYVVIIALFFARLPVSISGIGVMEGLYVGMFSLIGLSAEEGLALGLAGRLLDVVFPVPIVAIYFYDSLSSIRRAKADVTRGKHLLDEP